MPRDRYGVVHRPGSHENQSLFHRQLEPPDSRIEILSEIRARRSGGRRKRPHDQRAAGSESSEPVGHQMAQPAGDPVADHRVAHCLAYNEANPDGRARPGQRGLSCRLHALHRVHDEPGSPSAPTVPGHMGEVAATREPGGCGQHGAVPPVRPTVRSGPCGDEPTGSPAPHGYACAAGTRGSWHDGGCSAGRCACPCSRLRSPDLVLRSRVPSWRLALGGPACDVVVRTA